MWKRVPVLAGLAVLLAVCAAAPPTTKATERPIKILNESGSKVEIYWVHPQTGALSIMSTPNVLNGASFNLNSFIGHEFEIRELPSSKTGTCKGEEQTCRTNYLAVTENSEQSKYSRSRNSWSLFEFCLDIRVHACTITGYLAPSC